MAWWSRRKKVQDDCVIDINAVDNEERDQENNLENPQEQVEKSDNGIEEKEDKEVNEVSEEGTFIDKVVDILSRRMPQSSKKVSYLASFPSQEDNMRKLYKFAYYLQSRTERGAPLVVFVEHSEQKQNTRFEYFKSILRGLVIFYNQDKDFFHFGVNDLQYSKQTGILDVSKSMRKLSETLDDPNDHERTFLEIANVALLTKEMSKQDISIVQRLFSTLANRSSIIVYGKKSELKSFTLTTGLSPAMYFDLDLEYSIGEISHIITTYFNARMQGKANQVVSDRLKDYLLQVIERKDEVFVAQLLAEIKKNIIQKAYDGFDESFDFSLLKFTTSEETLENVVGLENVKKMVLELESFLEFQNKLKTQHDLRVPLSLHMAFKGPAGTGKTTVAREIGKILYRLGYVRKEDIVEVAAEDLVSQYVGQSAIKTAELMNRAMGGVLFVDEAYSIVKNKHGHESLATMIKIMEDHKSDIVVIFAGYKDEIDEFIAQNPGLKSRIGYHLDFEDYSAKELLEILSLKLKKYHLSGSIEFLDYALVEFEKAQQVENFGNGRFVDNFIQKSLFTHSLMIKKYPNLDQMELLFDYESSYLKQLELDKKEEVSEELIAAI